MSLRQSSLAKTAFILAGGGILVGILLVLIEAALWTMGIVVAMEVGALILGLVHQAHKVPTTGREFYVQLGVVAGILTGPLLGILIPGIGIGALAFWLPGALLGAAGGWILGACLSRG